MFLGMYIATCAFDKTISIFDFFSGEMVTQVSGHSELVTGVKFSPDGRFLVSIGGDGCILMWRVADFLVKTMQDRLVELMSSAQRQNLKAAVAVRKSHSESAAVPVEGRRELPPPPLPTPSFGLPAVDSSRAASGNPPKSRWAARVEEDHGYSLFGKKIDPTAEPSNLNKFTLELDNTTRAAIASASEGLATAETGLDGTSRKAELLEAGDDVMLSDEEDEGDGSHLFKPETETADEVPPQGAPKGEDDYESDFEEATNDSAAVRQLSQDSADSPGDSKTAAGLENWLEDMVRVISAGTNFNDVFCLVNGLYFLFVIFRSAATGLWRAVWTPPLPLWMWRSLLRASLASSQQQWGRGLPRYTTAESSTNPPVK